MFLLKQLRKGCSGKRLEPFVDEVLRQSLLRELSGQFEDRRQEIETVVRPVHCKSIRNSGRVAADKHQGGMRGLPEERAVIASGVEPAIIEIPVVVRKHDEIRLGKMPLPIVKPLKKILVRRGIRTRIWRYR